jgi:hypothetical protein
MNRVATSGSASTGALAMEGNLRLIQQYGATINQLLEVVAASKNASK